MLHEAQSLPAAHTGSLWRADLGNSTEPTKCSSASRTPWSHCGPRVRVSEWRAKKSRVTLWTVHVYNCRGHRNLSRDLLSHPIRAWRKSSGAAVAGQWELGYTAGQPICWDKGQPRWMLTRRLNSKMTQSTACWNLLQSKVRPLYKARVASGGRPEIGEQLGKFNKTVCCTLFEVDNSLFFYIFLYWVWHLTQMFSNRQSNMAWPLINLCSLFLFCLIFFGQYCHRKQQKIIFFVSHFENVYAYMYIYYAKEKIKETIYFFCQCKLFVDWQYSVSHCIKNVEHL